MDDTDELLLENVQSVMQVSGIRNDNDNDKDGESENEIDVRMYSVSNYYFIIYHVFL